MNNHSLESVGGLKKPAHEIIESHPVISSQLLHVQDTFPVYENGRLLDIGLPCHLHLLDTDFLQSFHLQLRSVIRTANPPADR